MTPRDYATQFESTLHSWATSVEALLPNAPFRTNTADGCALAELIEKLQTVSGDALLWRDANPSSSAAHAVGYVIERVCDAAVYFASAFWDGRDVASEDERYRRYGMFVAWWNRLAAFIPTIPEDLADTCDGGSIRKQKAATAMPHVQPLPDESKHRGYVDPVEPGDTYPTLASVEYIVLAALLEVRGKYRKVANIAACAQRSRGTVIKALKRLRDQACAEKRAGEWFPTATGRSVYAANTPAGEIAPRLN